GIAGGAARCGIAGGAAKEKGLAGRLRALIGWSKLTLAPGGGAVNPRSAAPADPARGKDVRRHGTTARSSP
ncbi:MAG: hypothetical protein AAFZ09_16440, partial [Pseudomonadota bacterium]